LGANNLTALRLESAPSRLSEHIRKSAKQWAERTFGEKFLQAARGYGRSARYQQSLKITMNGMDLEMELDYRGQDGDEPLGRWFEEGTETHWIEPKDPNGFLSWVSNGKRFYSKGHFVSGILPMPIMEMTLREGMEPFKDTIKRETEKFLEANALR
jgi:hypothetical protein